MQAAPLVTSGFWSKDAIFAAVLESGYVYATPLFAIAVIVAIMTAFYTFRMVGMAFFGEESKHVKNLKETGHHIHEVGKVMWLPFAILAVATIAVGLIGPLFEAQLHHTFAEYLTGSFGIKETANTENTSNSSGNVYGDQPYGCSGIGWSFCNRRRAWDMFSILEDT